MFSFPVVIKGGCWDTRDFSLCMLTICHTLCFHWVTFLYLSFLHSSWILVEFSSSNFSHHKLVTPSLAFVSSGFHLFIRFSLFFFLFLSLFVFVCVYAFHPTSTIINSGYHHLPLDHLVSIVYSSATPESSHHIYDRQSFNRRALIWKRSAADKYFIFEVSNYRRRFRWQWTNTRILSHAVGSSQKWKGSVTLAWSLNAWKCWDSGYVAL